MKLSNIVQRGWDAVDAGDFDTLVADYTDDITFIMPGQENIVRGLTTFRTVLDQLGGLLPPGFEITELRQIEGKNEVVSIVEWKSNKIEFSALSVLFRFEGDKIYEERWFVDTEQWKRLF
ncbi:MULTISPECIES: nuclear transport factor 2 family protein [unclassified Moritella]|uniref:nuclear transport factor 2 family protein n=1 Tax=unclassified Moritella TaxID=2637987 RepID=UPI001BA6A364|nr:MULTISPECIES: nuclear transport factor 2 family protein [unclassified Moritella]QUM83451.1 nuclear transport factor 2 family protein [Moritella sp. 28]QUM87757.1 nuclear transport factor 2 family protein [Moritella sp. 36]